MTWQDLYRQMPVYVGAPPEALRKEFTEQRKPAYTQTAPQIGYRSLENPRNVPVYVGDAPAMGGMHAERGMAIWDAVGFCQGRVS